MKQLYIILVFFIIFNSYSQSENYLDENIKKVEEFIIYSQLDSASYYLSKVKISPYQNTLHKILNNNQLTYSDYYKFTSKLVERETLNYLDVSNYINQNIKKPTFLETIDVDFFNIKWIQVSKLRDDAYLDAALEEQNKLEKYVNQFNEKDSNFIWATTKLKTHPIIMFLIEKKIVKGKKLALDCLTIARDLKDIELQIIFLNHYSDFLIFEDKLEEYIAVSEESLELEKQLTEKSSYYYDTVYHLLDAYIYKGVNNKKVIEFLNILDNSSYKSNAYSLYLMLVSKERISIDLKNEILKKFNVNNVLGLVNKFKILGKNLNSNDFNRFLNMSSKALEAHGYFKEALKYKDESITLTKKIYSEDLSRSLAKYKTEQAVKDKEIEIALQKDKTKLYILIAISFFILILIKLLFLFKLRKQSKELIYKNNIINKALVEKEILIKEVHHRVKNNFQIITSLLEFQSEGIEDGKTIELFNDGKDRVKSMALIHQKLYKNESGLIDFKDYIISLTKEISFIHQSEKEIVKTINVENIFFDVDTAIPLGLIINELTTNAYKYAFKKKKNEVYKILIYIEKLIDDSYKLIIEDNGSGIPKDFNIETSKSIGLRLVKRLIKQLDGSLKITINAGTRFEIIFKNSLKRNEIE